MSVTSALRTINLGCLDRHVCVRELTMADMRALLRDREDMESADDMEPLDLLLVGDGLLVADLSRLTDLSAEELERLTEPDLERIIAQSKKVNPRFFAQVLGALSRYAAASLNDAAPISSAES